MIKLCCDVSCWHARRFARVSYQPKSSEVRARIATLRERENINSDGATTGRGDFKRSGARETCFDGTTSKALRLFQKLGETARLKNDTCKITKTFCYRYRLLLEFPIRRRSRIPFQTPNERSNDFFFLIFLRWNGLRDRFTTKKRSGQTRRATMCDATMLHSGLVKTSVLPKALLMIGRSVGHYV